MNSSRMHTGHSLTVCQSLLSGGCLLLGGSAPGGVSQHALRQTLPVNRITDTSKNIALATTSLRPVMILLQTKVGQNWGRERRRGTQRTEINSVSFGKIGKKICRLPPKVVRQAPLIRNPGPTTATASIT